MDMDGTLVDTERELIRLQGEVAREKGFHFDRAVMVSTVGTTYETSVRIMHDAYPDAPHAAIREEVGKRFSALRAEGGIPVRKGAHALLDAALTRGMVIGLCTSTQRPSVESTLNAADLTRYFTTTVCADEAEHGKPHPAPYLLAAKRLGVAPENCLVVEDSPAGARSALAAGMRVVVVPDLIPVPDDLADRVTVLDSLLEVIDLL
jgi:HAD superfamily hydrolase (TIGR01509 family)